MEYTVLDVVKVSIPITILGCVVCSLAYYYVDVTCISKEMGFDTKREFLIALIPYHMWVVSLIHYWRKLE